MTSDKLIIQYPRMPIIGILSMCAVGLLISIILIYTALTYPAMFALMILDVVLVWILILGLIVKEREVHILNCTVTALKAYIKVKNNVRPI